MSFASRHLIRIGSAGWAIPRAYAEQFPSEGSSLERYAARFDAAEINSTFHRAHKPATFARWASVVPTHFRFAVKVPKEITHERRLVDTAAPLTAFLESIVPLGPTLGPLLVQLPPSLAFDARVAVEFLALLRYRFSGQVAWEPRHPTWFEEEADQLLARHEVARVAADPARVPAAARPRGWRGMTYYRLHGSPDMYRSSYTEPFLRELADGLKSNESGETWCIFDNTTLGAATGNALALRERISARQDGANTMNEPGRSHEKTAGSRRF